MDSTQGFHADHERVPDADVAAVGRILSARPSGVAAAGSMRLNPLTYGVAGVRRLMYWIAGDGPAALACRRCGMLGGRRCSLPPDHVRARLEDLAGTRTTGDLL